jgi:hypothetical protein
VGSKIEARYKGKSKYYPGIVVRDREDGTYDIDYDDGEKETRVDEKFIKKTQSSTESRITEGSIVETDMRSEGRYVSGKVVRDRGDGTYDIICDDGEREYRTDGRRIRLKNNGGDFPVSRGAILDVGDYVECNYRGRGKWFPGRIKRVRQNGSYDINYDDGESESAVPFDHVRTFVGSMRSAPKGMRNIFEVGSKIESNYKARGKYFLGRIVRVNNDGTYDIDYDDGENELRVLPELVRSLEKQKSNKEVFN